MVAVLAAAAALGLGGIPQHGTALGAAKAPVTVVEFADLQCPFCAQWAGVELPGVVRDYVRPGKVRLVFNGLHFLGRDSETALRTVYAAALQNRAWQVIEGLYARQGAENAGWVKDSLLRRVGAAAGADVARMLRARSSAAVTRMVRAADDLATRAGVRSVPSFAVARTGKTPRVVGAEDLRGAIAAALGH